MDGLSGNDISASFSVPNPKIAIDSSVHQTANQQGAAFTSGIRFGDYASPSQNDMGGIFPSSPDPLTHWLIIGLIVAGVVYLVRRH